ncbi:MAG: TetR/AcrR family transcriptional regulator [Candidatus Binatia bacterium]|nr:TetR/AcrR family transcriptional regulator [Candidatus Binatia bacterium]
MAARTRKQPQAARTTRRPRGRPRDERKRSDIIAAARRIFFAADPRKLRMERIAREAGVSKATLYAYFPNLTELLRAVIQDHRASMTRALDRLPQTTSDVRASLVEFGTRLVEFLTSSETVALQRMLAAEPSLRQRLGRLIYREGPETMRTKVARILSAAEARGDLRPHDSQRAAEQLLGMWQGIVSIGLLIGGRPAPSRKERERAVEHAVDVLLRAYGPSPNG